MIDELLNLLYKEDILYSKVIQGNKDILGEIDELILELLKITDNSEDRDELVTLVINAFSDKINIIYKLLNLKEYDVSIEYLRDKFRELETKRFNIVNNYVMGIVKVEEIDEFRSLLKDFRSKLYAIPISDNNILEIAKMKSKAQHYDTEVLEDEEVLKCAYNNIS